LRLGVGNRQAYATAEPLRVLIVAENASDSFGGEAALPLRYFKLLRDRGIPAWLITHARVRDELARTIPDHLDRIHFIEDSRLHRCLWWLGANLEPRLEYVSTGFLSRLVTQVAQRRVARVMVKQHDIQVVHQPTPVSAREPSLLTDLDAPVVIGPMKADTDYPPAFRNEESLFTRMAIGVGRASAGWLNHIFPGKRQASVLLVANSQSRSALNGTNAKVFDLAENGVDTKVWRPIRAETHSSHCRFVFVGRLIRSKGIDLFLRAFADVAANGCEVSGLIVGDGRLQGKLRTQAEAAGILGTAPNEPGKVYFVGWQSAAEVAELLVTQDCLVLPTLLESGGAVLLEAMAVGLPVIATKWGGPAEYVDETCGILVPPDSRESLVAGLAAAMKRLARDPKLRRRMGQAGRRKIERFYTWDTKIDRILDFYREAVRPTEAA
jgi:glycosyltransferase involved in cell wall biosynthesis